MPCRGYANVFLALTMNPLLLTDDLEVSEVVMREANQRVLDGYVRKSRLRKRWLDVQDHIFNSEITPERKAKIQRILAKLDRMIAAIPD